ncbi:TonB-dependent receptor [Thermodesulforhabdus norvegica]|uniref:Iron complex outermembrane recepter protein n=1 Tax=Thermodesulforhabdus norvegica TaxID=39841 RepID=A0A1I4S7Y9_9BACT|nr:TonB-dependent receptor [Thermodesulforhabdus norvegica]SFM60589.1 iron complex outermembrane recepter protein [Thermodesulforhabdus norvegica]
MKRFVSFGLVGVVLFFHGMGFAQDGEGRGERVYRAEEILVIGTPLYEASIVPEEEINIPTMGSSLLDALESQAGVQLRRTSPTHSEYNKLRLRGFDETRLRVELNGVPINRDGSYGTGPVHWSILSSENVERIEIRRGVVPAKYGNTLGGVINIVTKEPTEAPEISVSSVYGSFNTWDTRLVYNQKYGPLKWSIGGSHFQTDGYLRNNDNHRNNVRANVAVELPFSLEAGAGFEYSDMESGLIVYNRPDSPFYDDDDPDSDASMIGGPYPQWIRGDLTWGDGSHVDDENYAFSTYLHKKFDKGSARLDFRIWNQKRTEYYYAAEDPEKKIYERETDVEDNNWLLKGQADYLLGRHHLELGGELKQYGWGDQTVHFIDTAYFSPAINFPKYIQEGFEGQPKNKQYAALYLQDTWNLHPRWSVELGVRQEWFRADEIDPEAFGFDWTTEEAEIDESHLDPRLGLTFRPWEGGSINARFGIAHRYPTSPEHFWWYLNKGTEFFNTELKPEEAEQYELAVEQIFSKKARITVRGYYYDIDDYISSVTVPGTGMVVYNIENVDIKGIEIESTLSFTDSLQGWINLTLQDGSKDKDPWDTENRLENQLPDFPEKLLNCGVDYRSEKLKARLWLNYVGKREHYDGKDLVEMGDYVLINAFVSYNFLNNSKWGNWDLILSAHNILGEDYEEEAGYPMPGATVLVGLRASF